MDLSSSSQTSCSSTLRGLLILIIYFATHITSTRVRVNPTALIRNIDEENGPPVLVESIIGTLARLSCNITPPLQDDRAALVIWYKVGLKTPIYSFDTRESNFSQGTHWSDANYRERLSFTLDRRTGYLSMENTQQEDTGEYRCRVDFQKSPTRNSKVNLTVIMPPESIIILDHKGTTIKNHTMGPYNEGAMVNITCVAIGGQPQPRVTWRHENTVLDTSSHTLSDRRVGNSLSLSKLARKNLHMKLTCLAANNNITMPISNTVVLDMNLRPLLVKLQGENRPLSADTSYQLSCIVAGSRPAPTITWWKGSTPMKNTHEIAYPDDNMTTSILTFTPTIDDRGKYLSCRAEQSMIPESGMEDGWKLDIYHIPVVTLELGTNSINSTFREGIDVFFECNIKSNPWINNVSWRHNDNILENNVTEGIIVANQSLVLQNVSRARSGIYTCVGSNREGSGESNPVHLDIRFAPVCRQGQRTIYSTGRYETIKIPCEIEANPADLSYVWKFNATLGETIDIPASLIVIDRGRSIVHYTPMTANDYGNLLCWASNEIGDQTEPCIYIITPSGEPDPLANCTLLNQTSTGFQIECLEGFDGGLQQEFIMEVYVNGSIRHPKTYKSKTPNFEVRGLVPGAGYNIFLVAQNSKGRSNATILQVYTLKDPEKQTDLSLAYTPVIEDIRPFLGILVGVVVSIVLLALIIVFIVQVRGSTGRDRNEYVHGTAAAHGRNDNGIGPLHNSRDMQNERGGCHVTSSLNSIDKNPDIIPQDGYDEDDEWTTRAHNHDYATAAMAEQNAVLATSTSYDHINSKYALIDKKPQQHHLQQQHQQQHQQPHQQQTRQIASASTATNHGQYIQFNTLMPMSKVSAFQAQKHQQQNPTNQVDLTYAEKTTITGQHIPPYCSSTLGRLRKTTDLKRAESNIYSQIDLAHRPLYSTSPMFATNTISDVTLSNPSQLATFSTSPIPNKYTHKLVAASQAQSQTQNLKIAMASVSAANVVHTTNVSSGCSGMTVGGGGGGGGNNLQTIGMLPVHIPVYYQTGQQQQQQQSLISALNKKSQSPFETTSASNTPPSVSLASGCKAVGLADSSSGIRNFEGNNTKIAVNNMNILDVYHNEMLTNSSNLNTVPEEVINQQTHDSIIVAPDRSTTNRF